MRAFLFIAKAVGPGIVSYLLIHFLIGVGVPLDVWGVQAGKFVGAHMSAQMATWALILIIGVLLWSAEWWLPRLLPRLLERLWLVSIFDAGRWLYEHGNTKTKTQLSAMVPDPFDSIAQHGASYFVAASGEGLVQLYGRRERQLPREKVTADDADTTAINPVTGEGDRRGHAIDIAVKRSDLRKVLRWFEQP